MLCHPTDRQECSRMKTKTATSEDDLDWCYIDGCTKHPSPSGPPKRIQPTWSELIAHRDAQTRWDSYQTPPVSVNIKLQIDNLIGDAETVEDYLAAYQLAALAGMCYWSIKESDYIWRD